MEKLPERELRFSSLQASRVWFLYSECIEESSLYIRYIESIEYIGLEGFIDSCHDQDTHEDEYDTEYFLEPSALISIKAKLRNNSSTTESDQCEHQRESECIDERVAYTCYDWHREYSRKKQWIRRRTRGKNWTQDRSRDDRSEDGIVDILSLVEGVIGSGEVEFLSYPCPSMWEYIDESECEEDNSWEILPERWWDIDKCGRHLQYNGKEYYRKCERKRDEVWIPSLLLAEGTCEDHR